MRPEWPHPVRAAQASGSTTFTSSTSRLPWRSSEILMSSALTLVYFEITSISSRCSAGRKSGPARLVRSRAMMICRRSLASLALFALGGNRKESRAISLCPKNALQESWLFVAGEPQRQVGAEEARHHVLVRFGHVGALEVNRRIALVGSVQHR